jgi:hypothetical protein
MEASEDHVTEKVQSLSDLELAVLICLVADQHCIIEAERELTRDVVEELKLVGSSRSMGAGVLTFPGRYKCLRINVGCTGMQRRYYAG